MPATRNGDDSGDPMRWDELKALEVETYRARKARMAGVYSAHEAHDYENRVNRAEMGDDLDDQ